MLRFAVLIACLLTAPAAAEPFVGPADGPSFRPAERTWLRRAALAAHGEPTRFEPLPLAHQLDVLGFDAVHLSVVAPHAFGQAAHRHDAPVAARQAGLKVAPAGGLDPDAWCHALRQCLLRIDQWSQARGDHPPMPIILEARRGPRLAPLPDPAPERFFADESAPPPTAAAIVEEVLAALPAHRRTTSLGADGRSKLWVVVKGPEASVSAIDGVPVAGADVGPLVVDAGLADPGRLADAQIAGRHVVLLQAAPPEGVALTRDAVTALPADVVILSAPAARRARW